MARVNQGTNAVHIQHRRQADSVLSVVLQIRLNARAMTSGKKKKSRNNNSPPLFHIDMIIIRHAWSQAGSI